jgi:hypothetical protein
MESTVYRRTLSRAVAVAGSEEKLAQFLKLPLEDCRKWASGEADPPCAAFLALTDIVAANCLTPLALLNFTRLGALRRGA